MALNRAWYDALVDDDGSNTVGTVWGKDDIKNLLDSVDAEIARLDSKPECSIYLPNGNGQAVGSGALSVLLFDAAEYQVGGTWWSASDQATVVCPVGDVYLVTVGIHWDANPTGVRTIQIINTAVGYITPEVVTDGQATGRTTQTLSWVVHLGQGHGLQVHALQSSGATLKCGGFTYPNTNTLRVHRLF